MRLIKEECEIEEIDKACEIGYLMHTAARQACKPGVREQDIVGRMEGVTLSKERRCTIIPIIRQLLPAGFSSLTPERKAIRITPPTSRAPCRAEGNSLPGNVMSTILSPNATNSHTLSQHRALNTVKYTLQWRQKCLTG